MYRCCFNTVPKELHAKSAQAYSNAVKTFTNLTSSFFSPKGAPLLLQGNAHSCDWLCVGA